MSNMMMSAAAATTAAALTPAQSGGASSVANDTARLTVRIPVALLQRLEEIQKTTAASSATEVVKNAIILYDALIDQRLKGGEVSVKFPQSEKEAIIPIFVSR